MALEKRGPCAPDILWLRFWIMDSPRWINRIPHSNINVVSGGVSGWTHSKNVLQIECWIQVTACYKGACSEETRYASCLAVPNDLI